jgi:DNA-directed RNA polymerase specialized sigma24 family protein
LTKQTIITEYYNSQWMNDAIGKMHPEDLQQDLKQEVFMVLLEMDEEKLLELHANGFLKFYAVRTMLNMIKSDRSKFYQMFRNFVELGSKEQAEEVYQERAEVCFDCAFNTSREQLYEKDMFWHYTYTFDRNALALSKETGIPYKTVTRTLQNAKQRIKCYLQSQQQ